MINLTMLEAMQKIADRGYFLAFTDREIVAVEKLQDMGLVNVFFNQNLNGYQAHMKNHTFNQGE
jgi:hypothetical protein